MVISVHFVFLPTTLASLPPGVMLLNRSTTPRVSATDIENTSRKGAPEWEWPNRSVKKKIRNQIDSTVLVEVHYPQIIIITIGYVPSSSNKFINNWYKNTFKCVFGGGLNWSLAHNIITPNCSLGAGGGGGEGAVTKSHENCNYR